MNPRRRRHQRIRRSRRGFHVDYPIAELGDRSHSFRPRPCELISYDGNKYCDVLVEGIIVNVKRGYVLPWRDRNEMRFKVCSRCRQRSAKRDPHTAQDCKTEHIRTVMDS